MEQRKDRQFVREREGQGGRKGDTGREEEKSKALSLY